MDILGQEKILKFIDSLTLDTLPKSLMLVGEQGSGKHTICKYIADKFNLVLEPLLSEEDNDLTLIQEINERIDEIYSLTTPHMYIIDGSYFVSRGRGELNGLLKLLEEPPSAVSLVFLCETTANVLDTILSRCYQLKLSTYSKDTLRLFLTEDDWEGIISIVHNPGQLISFRKYSKQDVEDMFNYVYKIPDAMMRASYSNVLRISDKKLYFGGKVEKSSETKFTLQEFVLMMLYALKRLYLQNNDIRYYNAFRATDKLSNGLKIFNIDAKNLFEHYLIELKEIMSNDIARIANPNL